VSFHWHSICRNISDSGGKKISEKDNALLKIISCQALLVQTWKLSSWENLHLSRVVTLAKPLPFSPATCYAFGTGKEDRAGT